jgi:membrane peptidoglycan carboxypeptidase
MDPQDGPGERTGPGFNGPEDDRTEVMHRLGGEPGTAPPTIAPPGQSAGPQPPSGKVKKQRRRAVRYARRTAFTMLGLLGFGVIAFAVAYILTPVPSAKSASTASGPVFYYSDGKTVIARQGVNRQIVDLDKVPQSTRKAVLAAENRSFYTDPGVSLKGTARAVWSTVSGNQVQGGSTITQQMVRNYYSGLSQERTVFRKLKEVMVSLKVGEEKSKDWILEQYLNTIYFGRDAYGIQAASQAYFGKNVQNLTPAESAYLAAAIQQPTTFGTADKSDQAAREARWRYVLNGMVQLGSITQSQADAATFPKLIKEKSVNSLGGQKGYMVNIAIKELKQRGYTEQEISGGGLKVVTTFDKKLMSAAQDAVEQNVPDSVQKKNLVGMVSVDPSTGEVKSFYGGTDYLDSQLSNAFGRTAQAGSGFKPYVLAAALDDGYGLDTELDGSSPQSFHGHKIENDSGESYGTVNLVRATEKSINTAYVELGQKVGLDKVTEMAEKLGIPESALTANGANTAVSFPLGVVDVSPVQQAGAYSAFANKGVYVKPHVVKTVISSGGKKTNFTEQGTRVFSQQVADDATYAMQKVVDNGTGTRAQLDDGRPVAGKTGTTTNGVALWFNGFVPQVSTSVAVFREDHKEVNVPGFSAYGGSVSAQIWHDYMTVATANLPVKDFGDPSISIGGGYDNNPATDTPTPTPSTDTPTPGPSTRTPSTPTPSHSDDVPTIEPTTPSAQPTATKTKTRTVSTSAP